MSLPGLILKLCSIDAEDNPEYLKELLPIAQASHGLIVDALGSAFTLLRAQYASPLRSDVGQSKDH